MAFFEQRFVDIQKRLQNKELTVSELVDEAYKRIHETDDKIQAFLTLSEETARETAKALDAKLEQGDSSGVLFGMPIGIKDNIVTKGIKTTCASKMLENFVPVHNAGVVDKVTEAGAVTLGKLNLDEFAMGASTETSAFKQTRNPWNLDYVPGGSSGGSAAAVAAGQVFFALGSDTGGSVRQPAAFCGIVGMKPTYGRVSRAGLVAFASSFDQIGTMTRTVEDNAYLLQTIAGYDQNDSTSAEKAVPNYVEALSNEIQGLKIGVPEEYLSEGVDDSVKTAVEAALKTLEELGATWETVSLPHSKYAVTAYSLITSAEASANLARFDGVRYGYRSDNAESLLDLYENSRSEGFGAEVKRRMLLGTLALSADYYDTYFVKAQKVRTLIQKDFEDVFANYDVIIGPTTPTPAFKLGEILDDPMELAMRDILTTPANLAGVPAISVPCGFSNGLPLGLQIIGKPFAEETIYRVAYAYEQATEHHKARPQL